MYTKEEILAEIKRTSTYNSGKSLGQKAFKSLTGIGWYDWGKYWASWSLAVIEAGFEPQKKKIAYDDEFLTKQMISVIRKLGRYPSLSKLRIENYNSGFSYYEAIKKRKKYKVVNNIVEFCRNNKNYQDILEICTPLLKELEENKTSVESSFIGVVGYVYLIKSTLMHATVYKIGKTNDLERRSKELNQPSNDQILIHSIETDDPDGVESYWHKRFESKRYKNKEEWFILKPQDIQSFKKWKKIF